MDIATGKLNFLQENKLMLQEKLIMYSATIRKFRKQKRKAQPMIMMLALIKLEEESWLKNCLNLKQIKMKMQFQ